MDSAGLNTDETTHLEGCSLTVFPFREIDHFAATGPLSLILV